MCLAVLALHTVPGIPVLIAANRDEFHARPTLPAAQWADAAHVYGGRDALAGGTWMGATTGGRYALVTNFREPGRVVADAPRVAPWSRISCAAMPRRPTTLPPPMPRARPTTAST